MKLPTRPPTPAPDRVRPPHQRKAWRTAAVWLALAAVVGMAVAGLRPRPPSVDLATVTTGPLTVSVLEEGKTRIRHRHVVAAPVAGMLERIALRAGDALVAGRTVLAVIQPTPSGFLDPRARAEAEARVQMAEAAREQQQAQLERAQAALELAEKEKVRTARLYREGAASLREQDQAASQVDVLTREVKAAGFALEVSKFEILQARAAARQAGPADADTSSPITLLSPVSGFVLAVYEESARPVAAGLPLLEVGDPADLEAEIEMLSSDAVAVRPGAEAVIEQWGGERPLRGRVAVVEPGGFTKISALGVEEQRVRVRVDFVDPIPPGRPLGDRYRVEARIVTWHADEVLQVPAGALFRQGGEWMAFVFDGRRARLATVAVGRHSGVAAEVLSGLVSGQQVILHPPDAVADGARVRPRVTRQPGAMPLPAP